MKNLSIFLFLASQILWTACQQDESTTLPIQGKYALYQNGNQYTEVWIADSLAILIDNPESIHYFQIKRHQDSLTTSFLCDTDHEHHLMDQVRLLSVLKKVADGKTDSWVQQLKLIREESIAVKDSVFHILLTPTFMLQVRQEYLQRLESRGGKHAH